MFLCLTSMMWETLLPTFDQGHFLSTSAHYPGSWSRDSLLVPWSLMPQWQVLHVRREVFIIGLWSSDSTGVRCQLTVHIPWIVPIVTWGPLSLLVVPLASVNSFHHWLVIRQCSCMFDFSSLIRMLELVLCSGRDGAQDPRFFLLESRLRFCGLLWLVTWLIHWMVATIPESIYRSSLDGCIHTLDLDYGILCYGWLFPYHIYHVFEISFVLLCTGFPTAMFLVGCILIKHFTPLSLSGLML